MAVDLLGKQGHMLFNNHGWSKMLELAERYGWQPKGTQPPLLEMEEIGVVTNGSSDGDWDGNYFTNDRQRVSPEDAASLAAALERALEDIPDHDAMEDKTRFIQDERVVPWHMAERIPPSEWFSGSRKQRVRDFVTFCRAGGISIT